MENLPDTSNVTDIKVVRSEREKSTPITDMFMKTAQNKPVAKSAKNIALILTRDKNFAGKIAYDEFSESIVKLKDISVLDSQAGSWVDNDNAMLRVYVEDEYNFPPTMDAISSGLIKASFKNRFNPVKERIESQEWDGTKRAETFFIDYLGAEDTPYTREVTKVWLTGLVARIYQPGCKFEVVPMIQGNQGIGKSTLVSSLLPDYFLDELEDLKSKDSYQQLIGRAVVELGELSAMRRTDVNHVKSFLSAQSDYYRASFGRIASAHPRRCVFIGTVNDESFLRDETGNRRFFPLKCSVNEPTKDVFNIDDNDILQILAEAKTLYDDGQSLYISKDIMKDAVKVQQSAMIDDPVRESVLEYLDMPIPADWKNYEVWERRRYFQDYHDTGKLKDRSNSIITKNKLTELTATTTKEILMIVFSTEQRDLPSISRGGMAKKISLVVSNADGWKSSNHVLFNGKQVRGFKRDIYKHIMSVYTSH